MAATVDQLTHEALSLSEQERAQLAHTLLRSLDSAENVSEVDAAWEAEITRRVERVKQGTAKGRPAEDVFHDVRTRHQ